MKKRRTNMKKMTVLIFVVIFALAGWAVVQAQGPGARGVAGVSPSVLGPTTQGWEKMSTEQQTDYQSRLETFQKDTLALKQEITTKQMALDTEWMSAEPDEKLVRTLNIELANLRAQLDIKQGEFLIACRMNYGSEGGWSCPGHYQRPVGLGGKGG